MWSVHSDGRFIADGCMKRYDARNDASCCEECAQIQYSSTYRKLRRLALDAMEATSNVPHSKRNHNQMVALAVHHNAVRTQHRLQVHNLTRKVATLQRGLNMHQRMVYAISQQNIPRLHQLVAVQLRNGRSIAHIVSKMAEAFAGTYKPKVCAPRKWRLRRVSQRWLLWTACDHAVVIISYTSC
jgi:hypothetical protein